MIARICCSLRTPVLEPASKGDMSNIDDSVDSRLETLSQALVEFRDALREPQLDPDSSRSDWQEQSARLDEILQMVDERLVASVDHVRGNIQNIEARAQIAHACANLVADAAGLMQAAGRSDVALRWLRWSASWTAGSEDGRHYAAAERDLGSFAEFTRVWWLHHNERPREARELAQRALGNASPSLGERLQDYLDVLQPIKSAPRAFSINGIGARFYGRADIRDDGLFRITRYITLVFVPLIPLDSFWVRNEADGWRFFAKAKLSSGQRWWQRGTLVLATLSVVSALLMGHFGSLSHRVDVFVEDARESVVITDEDSRKHALASYERFFSQNIDADLDTLAPALEHYTQVLGGTIAKPFTPASLPAAKRAIRRFAGLPDALRWSRGADAMLTMLHRWAQQCAEGNKETDLIAALSLLDDALRITDSEGNRRFTSARDQYRVRLGDALADAWPIDALAHYTAALDLRRGMDQATALLQRLAKDHGETVGPWLEMRPSIERWSARAAVPDAIVAFVDRDAALADTPERVELLSKGDLEALSRALAASPNDQVLATAVAHHQRAAGESSKARATLNALGQPGLLRLESRLLLAGLLAEAGDLAPADLILEHSLGSRLPSFAAARTRYTDAINSFERAFIARAQAGTLPAAVMDDLIAEGNGPNGEKAQAEAFGEHLRAALEKDAEIQRLTAAYQQQSDVVPLAIQLASLRLRRANAASGTEREGLLASAERTFLSIQSEASGAPAFHLGLGQVYHRLGKVAEGDAELGGLVERNDHYLTLAVAGVYRELGVDTKAIELSERVYEGGDAAQRQQAARIRSVLASDVRDKQTWLERCNADDPDVRNELLSVRAHLDLEAGRSDAAAKKFLQVADHYSKSASSNSSAANNAALALLNAHRSTGKPALLVRAVDAMANAARLTPENAIVLGNYASVLHQTVLLDTLGAHVRVEELRLDSSDASSLYGELRAGELRDELSAALLRHPQHGRLASLIAQWETMAPSATSAYRLRLSLHHSTGDDAAIAKLATRVARVSNLDTSRAADIYRKYLSGQEDDSQRPRAKASVEVARDRVRRVRKKGHRPTLAAALALLSERELEMLDFDPSSPRARAAVSAAREAVKLWPGRGFELSLAHALEYASITELLEDQTKLRAIWDRHQRALGSSILHIALEEGDGELLTALKNSRALLESAKLRAAVASESWSARDAALAELTGHTKLASKVRSYAHGPVAQTRAQLGSALAPYDERTQLELTWLGSARRIGNTNGKKGSEGE